MRDSPVGHPKAITMWDFSWLERRWPGAGYEDWDEALDGLVERGYDAIRIDAYPHLVYAGAEETWELPPVWSVNDWGAPMRCKVQVQPALTEFLEKCARRDIVVGLSSWYRRDTSEAWRMLFNPRKHAEAWLSVLSLIRDAGLIDTVYYIDLCNEWPMRMWAPFLYGLDCDAAAVHGEDDLNWFDKRSLDWMRESIAIVGEAYPDIPLTYSIHPWGNDPGKADFLDLYDPHIWMSGSDFYKRINWTFQHKYDYSEYELVQRYAEKIYRSDEAHWQEILRRMIDSAAEISRRTRKPLITTECWGITDYKDGPLLNWEWVKELCAEGTKHAAQTGRWCAIATSNFCGPQFVGMWRDVEWHRALTDTIHASEDPTT